MIRCIAVDDEPLALEVIRKYASETPMIKLCETFIDAFKAMAYLKTHPIDLIFIDIQMPDINGIQFIESLNEKPLVVFTTAYSKFAVRGFELEALDYLIKPIKFDRFIQAVGRARKTLERDLPPEFPPENFIFVKSEYQSIKVSLNDILYIQGLDDYIKIYLQNQVKPILSLISLKSIMEKLPGGQFMRVHRSFIIPKKHIERVHNRYIFMGDTKIPIGDTYVRKIQDWLADH